MAESTKRVTRRAALGAGAVAAATALGACDAGTETAVNAPVVGRNKRTLKMTTAWPPNFPGPGISALRLAKRIEEATDGTITVRVLAAGELVGAFEAFDAVSTGAADAYHAAEYYWQGKNRAFNFFTSVPFGLTTAEYGAWIHHGGGQALWDELAATFNIKPVIACSTGTQMGGWFNREINTLDDLRGLKMRMPGLGGEVLRRVGANVIALPGQDIFPALQNGTIDATEWIGPWNDLAFGFHKAAKFYYAPGWHEPGAALAVGWNLKLWNELQPWQQAAIAACCMAEYEFSYAEFNHQSALALRTLTETHGVQMRRFPDEVLRELGRISADVLREAGESDPFATRVYASFMAARAAARTWTAISDEAFYSARNLAGF